MMAAASSQPGGNASASGRTTNELRVPALKMIVRCAAVASPKRRAAKRAKNGTITAYAMNTAAVAPSSPHEPLTARICAPAMSNSALLGRLVAGGGTQNVNR